MAKKLVFKYHTYIYPVSLAHAQTVYFIFGRKMSDFCKMIAILFGMLIKFHNL